MLWKMSLIQDFLSKKNAFGWGLSDAPIDESILSATTGLMVQVAHKNRCRATPELRGHS
jgi:hypothetical protein